MTPLGVSCRPFVNFVTGGRGGNPFGISAHGSGGGGGSMRTEGTRGSPDLVGNARPCAWIWLNAPQLTRWGCLLDGTADAGQSRSLLFARWPRRHTAKHKVVAKVRGDGKRWWRWRTGSLFVGHLPTRRWRQGRRDSRCESQAAAAPCLWPAPSGDGRHAPPARPPLSLPLTPALLRAPDCSQGNSGEWRNLGKWWARAA